jgi:hypothetical protein
MMFNRFFVGHSGQYVADVPLSPSSQSGIGTKVDPFYSYHSRLRDAPASASLFNYVRPRYHDDSYRKSSIGDAAAAVAAGNSPAKFNQTPNSGLRLTSEERAKSRSMHELTPDRPTDTDRPSSSSNETRRYGQTPSYTSGARRHHTMVGYEDEVRIKHSTRFIRQSLENTVSKRTQSLGAGNVRGRCATRN